MTYQNFDGPGGGELSIDFTDIGKVDGSGTWVLWGQGQDLVIHEKKDGDSKLTLHSFGNIVIARKDGRGELVIAEDNASVLIASVNGDGPVHLDNSGLKRVVLKDGRGDIMFKGAPPFVSTKNGAGNVVREG